MKTKYFIFLLMMFCYTTLIFGQQLTYKPVNPNFGGNYLNYSWLLSSANAQNPYDDANMNSGYNNSPVSSFSDSVKRQILNQLTRNLLGNGTGGDAGIGDQPGTFEIGGLVITVENTRSGSIITIIDTQTGETTEILI